MDAEYRIPDAISYGFHASPNEGACVMETVALFAGEPFSDRPVCACPVITEFAIYINDRMPDDATRTQLLGPLVPLIAGSRRGRDTELRRMYVAADYAVRVFAPLALEARGHTKEAATLRALPRIHDRETALTADTAAHAAAYAAAHAAAYAAHATADAATHATYAAYAADAAAATHAAHAAAYAADAVDAAAAWEQAAACLRMMCETE